MAASRRSRSATASAARPVEKAFEFPGIAHHGPHKCFQCQWTDGLISVGSGHQTRLERPVAETEADDGVSFFRLTKPNGNAGQNGSGGRVAVRSEVDRSE